MSTSIVQIPKIAPAAAVSLAFRRACAWLLLCGLYLSIYVAGTTTAVAAINTMPEFDKLADEHAGAVVNIEVRNNASGALAAFPNQQIRVLMSLYSRSTRKI